MSNIAASERDKILQRAKKHLREKDAIMHRLIEAYPDISWKRHSYSGFECILHSIVAQQISKAAAESTWRKLNEQLDKITPQRLIALDPTKLKQAGFSRPKISYAHNLSKYALDHDIEKLAQADYKTIYNSLIKIKGVGQWTIDMFAIFYAFQADIFPKGDIAVLNSIRHFYNQSQPLSTPKLTKITKIWAPYRTVATLYLWKTHRLTAVP